jgi:hypothetical protein
MKTAGLQKSAVFPVTIWQKYILDQSVHPDCPDDLRDRSLLSNAFLMRPGIDLRRLRRAVHKLRLRHDSLRIRFVRVKHIWQAVIDPPEVQAIQEIDLGNLEDDVFNAEIRRLANARMPLVNAPLAEVIVVRCGDRGDVLITRVHHAITDGYGMVVLTEDLTKLLIGLPIEGVAVSHAQYIARFESPLPSRAGEIAEFWAKLHSHPPKAPLVGRKAKGMKPLHRCLGVVEQKNLTCTATPASLRRLEAKAASAQTTATTTFFAGYLEAIGQIYDLDRFLFTTHVSRIDPAIDSYVGDHTLDPILPFEPGGKRRLGQLTEALGNTMIEAMSHLPSEAARRGTAYETALIDAGCYPGQFSVYQPRATARQDKSAFRDAFYIEYGEEKQIGPFFVTFLDVSRRSRKIADMQLDLGSARLRKGFQIHFDGISYTDAEIEKVSETVCDLLDLEMTGTVIT